MSVQRTKTTSIEAISDLAAVQEAMRVLEQHQAKKTAAQRWVCEVCGMIHTGSAPETCNSCGNDSSLVQLTDFRREIGSRW
jgi:rubrerythrin